MKIMTVRIVLEALVKSNLLDTETASKIDDLDAYAMRDLAVILNTDPKFIQDQKWLKDLENNS